MATDRLEQLINKLNKSWQRDAKKAIKYFQKLLADGVKVDAAIDKVQKHYLGLFTLPELRPGLVEAAAYAYGIVPSVLTTAQVELMGAELSRAWDASGMKLSEKLHGAEQKMRKAIIDTVREQMRQNRTWQQAARALYDGYMDGENVYSGGRDIIRRQEMARYMQAVRHATDGSPQAVRQQAQALERINALARRGAPNKALQAAYNELLEMVQMGEDEQIARAAAVAINEKSRYVAERITRTEMARAWADGFWAKAQADNDIVAVKYKLSSRHPVFDICDMYAKADMFGLGAGVYPKDKVPALPVHPHCLCRYVEVIHGEVDIDKEHEQVRAAGDKWLNELPAQRRAQVLGRAGAEAWEDGADWRKYMRGFSGFREAESRLKNISGKGIIKATKIWEGHDSLPKKSKPHDVIDHVDKNGIIKARAFYNATGFKYKEIHTTNHGKPKAHHFGIRGEHGHDYEWGLDGNLKNKTRRDLTDQERKENQNII